ncbi:hypothetical protein [Arthrobacter sp. NPDC058192]|uniref:hypothetical protein n=1 Tax=Arthrobacter sp. NPDC058192 TaxID=3346372 RepID=UPI0036EDA5EA
MVTMLGWSGAPTPESGLHLALAPSSRHALHALLATETPDRVPASDITGADDGRNNEQTNDQQPREGNRGQNAVNKATKDPADG